MQCSQTGWLTNAEWLERFQARAAGQRVPLTGSLELTKRCNLECIHCYLGRAEDRKAGPGGELSTGEVFSLLDEVTAAGCLDLLLTGGEPLLRKDFGDIYRRAKEDGLLVSVFTNGTLITDELLVLFSELPPKEIEVSIYGATATTFEQVTRVKGSFGKCREGVERLLAAGVAVRLKTVLMTTNRHELSVMKEMARGYGVRFRFDPDIFPCLTTGDRSPLELRVPAAEVVAQEMSDPERARRWADFYEKRKDIPVGESLYACGAGLTNFYIDSCGNLSPCVMMPRYSYSMRGSGFLARWKDDIGLIREKKPRKGYECNSCEARTLCTCCPAFFAVESGEEDVQSEYICAMGRLRHEAICARQEGGS